jgi:hypothetical protein
MAILSRPTFRPVQNRSLPNPKAESAVAINEKTITPNYVKLRVSTREWGGMEDIEMWCQETGCGKRVNQHCFAFKDEGSLMMFMLKWAPDTSNMHVTSG